VDPRSGGRDDHPGRLQGPARRRARRARAASERARRRSGRRSRRAARIGAGRRGRAASRIGDGYGRAPRRAVATADRASRPGGRAECAGSVQGAIPMRATGSAASWRR
jgi:hypothetical protein